MNITTLQIYTFSIFCAFSHQNELFDQNITNREDDSQKENSSEESEQTSDLFSKLTSKCMNWVPEQLGPKGLPHAEQSKYFGPILQCLHMYRPFRMSVKPYSNSWHPPLLAAFNDIFKHIDGSVYEKSDIFPHDQRKPEVEETSLEESFQIFYTTFLSECKITEKELSEMSLFELQKLILVQCESAKKEINFWEKSVASQSFLEIETCLNCSLSTPVQENSELITDMKIPRTESISTCLDTHYNSKLSEYEKNPGLGSEEDEGLDLSATCECDSPELVTKREYKSLAGLRIIHLTTPPGYRSPIPENLTLSDDEFELLAFIVETPKGDVFPCIKFEHRWYSVIEQKLYSICFIDYLLERGDQNKLLFYRYSDELVSAKRRKDRLSYFTNNISPLD